jgi:hypothetical protein
MDDYDKYSRWGSNNLLVQTWGAALKVIELNVLHLFKFNYVGVF